ncbi:MAG: asparagine synthase (glutamine-hydrolyzing) [Candidatus Wallbacteria bacterium]
MCGIAGIINLKNDSKDYTQALTDMCSLIAHRGPDGQGIFVNENKSVNFGHRRLSIIDLSENASQPMQRKDLGLVITFNGEIYNYLEIKNELLKNGYSFSSASDTEVVLCAYHKWGTAAFEKFNGMWAFAIYDKSTETIIISRDRFGVKPIYFNFNDGIFTFASEIKAFSKLIKMRPNLKRVYKFFAANVMPDRGETFFQGIMAFPQGNFLKINLTTKKIERHCYYNFNYQQILNKYDYSEPVKTFSELLDNSIKLRMRSDVPIGTCLSGGLDSSSIVSVITKKFGIKVLTFSALYDEKDCNEKKYIDAVCSDCETTRFSVTPSGGDIEQIIEKLAYYQDEPSYGPGLFSQWFVMKLANPHVKVLLDGQGADEILGGYTYFYGDYFKAQLIEILNGGLSSLKNIACDFLDASKVIPIKTLLGSILLKSSNFSSWYLKKGTQINMLNDKFRRRFENIGTNQETKKYNSFENGFWAADNDLIWELPENVIDSLKNMPDCFSAALYYALSTSSIPQLLRYEDRNSMAFSIESRTPFLDYNLAEFSIGLKYRDKIRGSETKSILRKAMAGTLTQEVLERKDKMGYPTPFYKWIKNECRDYIKNILFSDALKKRGILNAEYCRAIFDGHIDGKRDYSWEIWRAISIENWFRKFID